MRPRRGRYEHLKLERMEVAGREETGGRENKVMKERLRCPGSVGVPSTGSIQWRLTPWAAERVKRVLKKAPI